MRYILQVTGIVFLCAAAGGAFTVSGICNDFITGSPIDTCRVLLEAFSPGPENDSARSDADGLYSFENAEAGVYRIVVSDNRYFPDTVWATVDKDTTVSFILYDLLHLLDSMPDTLYKERSPYLVRKGVSSNSPLTIMPGTRIRFIENGTFSLRDKVTATGEAQDSILFFRDSPSSGTEADAIADILIYVVSDTCHFSYCVFRGFKTIRPYGFRRLHMENCLFTGMSTAVTFDHFGRCIEADITGNTIVDCENGLTDLVPGEYAAWATKVICRNNLVQCSDVAFRFSAQQEGFIEHNTFIGSTMMNLEPLHSTDTIRDNIFTNIAGISFSNDLPFVSHNAINSYRSGNPFTIGSIVTLNQNGDSCDYLYNVADDPRIADSTTGQLYKGSVCIAAASDGTNIGMYQGESAGVEKVPEAADLNRNKLVHVELGDRFITVFVTADHLHSADVLTVQLFSLDGRCVFTEENNTHRTENTISVHRPNSMVVSSGCYFLQVYGDRYRYSVPVILKSPSIF